MPVRVHAGSVVPPWDWTPGKVKARKYNTIQKGVHKDTTTNFYRRAQDASGARFHKWSV